MTLNEKKLRNIIREHAADGYINMLFEQAGVDPAKIKNTARKVYDKFISKAAKGRTPGEVKLAINNLKKQIKKYPFLKKESWYKSFRAAAKGGGRAAASAFAASGKGPFDPDMFRKGGAGRTAARSGAKRIGGQTVKQIAGKTVNPFAASGKGPFDPDMFRKGGKTSGEVAKRSAGEVAKRQAVGTATKQAGREFAKHGLARGITGAGFQAAGAKGATAGLARIGLAVIGAKVLGAGLAAWTAYEVGRMVYNVYKTETPEEALARVMSDGGKKAKRRYRVVIQGSGGNQIKWFKSMRARRKWMQCYKLRGGGAIDFDVNAPPCGTAATPAAPTRRRRRGGTRKSRCTGKGYGKYKMPANIPYKSFNEFYAALAGNTAALKALGRKDCRWGPKHNKAYGMLKGSSYAGSVATDSASAVAGTAVPDESLANIKFPAVPGKTGGYAGFLDPRESMESKSTLEEQKYDRLMERLLKEIKKS